MADLLTLNHQLELLHDSTLTRIELFWLEGTVRVGLKMSDGNSYIIAKELARFDCPRAFPWGRSASVNFASLRAQTGGSTLTIEIQSGDQIIIDAREFVIVFEGSG